MRVVGFPCKTPGCTAWLKVFDLPDDSMRTIHIPINVDSDKVSMMCPDCRQTHDYRHSEKEIRGLEG
jgi:hypothetical protein